MIETLAFSNSFAFMGAVYKAAMKGHYADSGSRQGSRVLNIL